MDGEFIDVIDFSERRLALKINVYPTIVSLIAVTIFGSILHNGYSSFLGLVVLVLLIPGIFLHETLHYIFQWAFSKKRPIMGFKFPHPYSALSSGASMSRNEAVICALAPLIVLTALIVTPAFFIPWLPRVIRVILLSWATVEAMMCCGDLYLVIRLLKHKSDVRLQNMGPRNVVYRVDK